MQEFISEIVSTLIGVIVLVAGAIIQMYSQLYTLKSEVKNNSAFQRTETTQRIDALTKEHDRLRFDHDKLEELNQAKIDSIGRDISEIKATMASILATLATKN